MDAETRKTLESNAAQLEREATTLLRHAYETNDYETRKARQEGAANAREDAAAIRAALREVDRLQAEVADLTATLDGAVDLRKSIEREREEARYQVDALTQQVADLEARAIPKEWVDNARTLTLEIEHHDFTGRRIQYFKPRGAELCSVTDVGDHHDPIDFPTLSAALNAAKEAP